MSSQQKSNAVKPPALAPGGTLRIVCPASLCKPKTLSRGIAELERRGYRILRPRSMKPQGYFAGSAERRAAELRAAFTESSSDAVMCARGGYGSAAVLEHLRLPRTLRPKLLIGYSDITVLQAYLWGRFRWPTLYGPMAGAGWHGGVGRRGGLDLHSFLDAASGRHRQWSVPLRGETLVRGEASGVLLGGCLTLLEDLIGTQWDLDTRGSILVVEDLRVQPYQLDRMLLHMRQAGKFRGVRGIILGEFPQYGLGHERAVAFREVCHRLLAPLGVPMVFGVPVGHTTRAMLTLPLGVRARLRATGEGTLEILESPVIAQRHD